MTNNSDDRSTGQKSGTESKLDLWLKQTIQKGSHNEPAGQKIIHQSAPNQPAPNQPAPNQPAPNQPAPNQPAPNQPAPNQSAPNQPAPNQSAPNQPAPNQSAPNQPAPTGKSGQAGQPSTNNKHLQWGERFNNNKQKGSNRFNKKKSKGKLFHRETFFKNARHRGVLKVIALSGLNEVGRNCMALEYFPDARHAAQDARHATQDARHATPSNTKSDIIIIDMGFQFPEADFLGVDYIIPDTTYLEEKKDRIRAIVFTHGHLDHIGGIPYIIPKLNFPDMYGTQLTMGLAEKRLKEFGLTGKSKINVITAEDKLKLGPFEVDFFNVTHSIPDSVGLHVKTPAGDIVHTGDFKFDLTPTSGQKMADFDKISAFSHRDISALFIDSTNAGKPGHTITEQKIGESLDDIVKNTEGRILIASFASQIGRIQQIVNIAQKHNRKILLSGRSLEDNFEMAGKMGYLRYSPNLIAPIHKVKKIHDHEALILTTGSQGEDVSALTRISMGEHSMVKIKKGDTVILSSTPIPGNERSVFRVINNLTRLGARVIDNKIMDVHASGHGREEDLKLMMTLVKPKAVVPIHGEYYMRAANKQIAENIGYTDEQAIMIENGDILHIENGEVKKTEEKVSSNYILIDGIGVGDIGAQVIMDRQTLAENGVLILMIPVHAKSMKIKGEVEVISRGFIYMKESEELVKEMAKIAEDSYRKIINKRSDAKRAELKKFVRDSVNKFVHKKLERYPLILPVIIEK